MTNLRREAVKMLFLDMLWQALKGLWRNWAYSLVSIFVLVSCLLFVGSFGLIALNVSYNFEGVSSLNEIEVFLEFDADADTAMRIESEILRLDNVESVTFVSKEDGLLDMQGQFADYGYLFEDITDEENQIGISAPFDGHECSEILFLIYLIAGNRHRLYKFLFICHRTLEDMLVNNGRMLEICCLVFSCLVLVSDLEHTFIASYSKVCTVDIYPLAHLIVVIETALTNLDLNTTGLILDIETLVDVSCLI